MRIGLLYDHTFTEKPGGTGRFADRMIRTVPDGVDVILCPPGGVDRDCDAYCLFSTKRYSAEEYEHVLARPFVRFEQGYWRDTEGGREWRDRLNACARLVGFNSPLHLEVYQTYHGELACPTICLPPPLDPAELAPYRARWDEQGRGGAIWFGEWSWLKAPDIAQRWALENEQMADFFSPNLPNGTQPMNPFCHLHGFMPDDGAGGEGKTWWDVVASHERFIHFPRQPECWPWSVHEAYLLGCEITIAGRFGIESYEGGMEKAVERAAETPARWWEEALNAVS